MNGPHVCVSSPGVSPCRRVAMMKNLLAPYEQRPWAQTNWILVRLWRVSSCYSAFSPASLLQQRFLVNSLVLTACCSNRWLVCWAATTVGPRPPASNQLAGVWPPGLCCHPVAGCSIASSSQQLTGVCFPSAVQGCGFGYRYTRLPHLLKTKPEDANLPSLQSRSPPPPPSCLLSFSLFLSSLHLSFSRSLTSTLQQPIRHCRSLSNDFLLSWWLMSATQSTNKRCYFYRCFAAAACFSALHIKRHQRGRRLSSPLNTGLLYLLLYLQRRQPERVTASG